MDTEYTTGEFAKLCNVSKRTLIYYDQIDLLKPARVDGNGYRFYTLYQCDVMSRIKLFQTIGLSLKEIQEIFDMQDLSLKSKILDAQKQMIQKQILELQETSNEIDFLGDRLAAFQKIGLNELCEERLLEDEHYLTVHKDQRPSDSYNFLNYGFQYGLLFKREELLETVKNELPKSTYFFRRANSELGNFIKKKGRYLSVFYLPKNEEVISCVNQFVNKIDLDKTIGPLFHEDYCSELLGYKDYFVIKLSIKLKE